MGDRFHKNKSKSAINDFLETKKSVSQTDKVDNFKISFQYMDSKPMYASSYKHWQEVGLLSKALEVLGGYCCRPLRHQVDGDKFAIYGDFPKVEETKYERPNHVPEDADWARIHITGPAVIVGHVVDDTFYVVYLDKTHKFWLTKRYRSNH
jgi:hypothetical protein